jgi:periplasmic protein TonB
LIRQKFVRVEADKITEGVRIAGEEMGIMVKLKPKNQSDRETNNVSYYNFRHQHLLLFILVSLLFHGLGLLFFGVYQHQHSANKEKIESKPIEFVVIPPEKTQNKPPPETQKRAVENSVAEKTSEPKETRATDELAEEISPRPTPPPASNNAPKITSPPPTPPQAAAPPKTPPKPTPPVKQATVPPKAPPKPIQPTPPQAVAPKVPPKPTPSPTENQPPVLSGSDTASVTKPQPKPAPKNDTVATRLPPNNQPNTPTPPSEQNNTTGNTGAAGLLGGDYQKTIADGGNDAFFSPEALAYEKVLNPDQIDALKDIDLSQYFAEIKRRVKSNWNPSYAAEEYTTFLTFEIQKNGQVTGLRVAQSSGSEEVDRESLTAVQNSAPFAPLPPEFPLAALEVEFSFNIYIY